MKTVALFIESDVTYTFLLFDGDKTVFDNVFVNLCQGDTDEEIEKFDKLQDELNLLVYTEEGKIRDELIISKEQAINHICEGANLIICGFIL